MLYSLKWGLMHVITNSVLVTENRHIQVMISKLKKKDCEHNELKPGDSSVNDVSETSLLLSLFSHSVVSDSLCPHRLQHAGPPCPSPTPGAYPNSCPSSQCCHPTILSSVSSSCLFLSSCHQPLVIFSSCLQSFPHQGLFQ